jgi:hypothetical protein
VDRFLILQIGLENSENTDAHCTADALVPNVGRQIANPQNLGLMLQLKIRKFLWCTGPQIASPQIFTINLQIANPQITKRSGSVNRKHL